MAERHNVVDHIHRIAKSPMLGFRFDHYDGLGYIRVHAVMRSGESRQFIQIPANIEDVEQFIRELRLCIAGPIETLVIKAEQQKDTHT